jgi:Ca2+/H+ antiporter, TMEM165/GDT1 family
MGDLWAAFWLSCGVVFVAELGDKSQLIALTFATRYRPALVLTGIVGATALINAISVAVGYGAGAGVAHPMDLPDCRPAGRISDQ